MPKLLPKINIGTPSGSPVSHLAKTDNSKLLNMENRKKQQRIINVDLKTVLPQIKSTKNFKRNVVYSVIGSG